jgi:hypothetical protein
MQGCPRSRRRVVATLIALGVVAAACGSDTGTAGGNTTPPTASTNTLAPEETTTIPSTAAPPTAETTTPPTTEPATTPTAPVTTEPATTEVAATQYATIPPTTEALVEFTPVESPTVPAQTRAVQLDNTRPDGVYYATVSEGGDPPPAEGSVVFEIVQLFIGDACVAHFGTDDEDACVSDYGVETDPTAALELPLGDQHITVVDAATQQSYAVSGTELYQLILGDMPADGAPPDYVYSGFGYLVTFKNGTVTALEQWWTP